MSTPDKGEFSGILDEEGQKKLVNESIESTQALSFMMNRALDNGRVDQAFSHASQFVEFLRTDSLNPHNYYALYHVVSQSLLELNFNISDKERFTDQQICEQYETAQYHRGCLQRLYLMITVGPEIASRGLARVLDVLDDLSEMIRQSQDVIHALFIRHYFLSVFKQHLPDNTQSDMERSLHFLLHNLAQMNRMWVRISDAMAEESKREQRLELSVLIGMNITRISSLKNLSPEGYRRIILPYIAKHVELCEDDMAQTFLLQSIIHAFPEDFHILTVDQLFTIFGKVEQNTPVLSIVNQLLDRFLQYQGELIDQQMGKSIFVTIAKNIEELFNSEGHLALTDKFATLEKLLRFSLKLDPNNYRDVKNLMKFVDFNIDLAIGDEVLAAPDASVSLKNFIETPLKSFDSAKELFDLEYLPILIRRLLPDDRKAIASIICEKFVNSSTKITSIGDLTYLLSLTSSLVREGDGKSCFYSTFHLIDAGSVQATMGIIQELANALDSMTEKASENAILPLGFMLIKLIHSADKSELGKIVQFFAQFARKSSQKNVRNAIMLFVEAAKTLDFYEFESETSELADLAVELFAKIQGTKLTYCTFLYLVQFIVSCRYSDLALNSQLCTIATSFTDPLQSASAFLSCANLFWRPDGRLNEANNVQACLSKASKAAAECTDIAVALEGLYGVLGTAAFFLSKKAKIDPKWTQALVAIITEKHQGIQEKGQSLDTVLAANVKAFYLNTVKYIQENGLISGEVEDDEEDEEEED